MPKKLKSECFKIVNINGEPVLFRTDDVTKNKFTFTITNLTGEPLQLTGGDPVKQVKGESSTSVSGSSFNFSFESMLTEEAMKKLQLTLPAGWKAAFFEGTESLPPTWSIAPTANITLAVNDVIKVVIENIRCGTTRPGNFEIMYRAIPGYADTLFPVSKHLSVVNPPDDKKLPLPLDYGYINAIHPIQGQTIMDQNMDPEHMVRGTGGEAVPVYVTYDSAALIQNGFTFVLTNTSKEPLVPSPGAYDLIENAVQQPTVYISFLFGDEDYAITTQQLADNNIAIDVNAKLLWQPARHVSGTAYWEFSPMNKQVMQGYETVYFPIRKLITPLNVPPDAISILYIQVNDIPGYNDKVYTLQLQKKKAKAKMESLEVSKRNIDIGEDITLTWKSTLAKRVAIDYKTRDGDTIVLDSTKGDIKLDGTNFKLPIPPSAEQTVITAIAYDDSATISTLERTIMVSQKPAKIISFSVDTPLVDVANTADMKFSWEVTNAKKLVLLTPEGEKTVTKTGSYTYKGPKTPFRFTLKAYSYYNMEPGVDTAVTEVFTYKTEKQVPVTLKGEKMQPLPAVLINQQQGKAYVVNSDENEVYDINANSLAVNRKYPGNVMLLSKNGEKLFVFNPDKDLKVFGTRMFDTITGQGSRNYYIVPQQAAGAYPGAVMLVTPDLTKFYTRVVFNFSGYLINVQVYNINAGANRLDHFDTANAAYGTNISAMAFNNPVDKLYVVRGNRVEVVRMPDHRWNKYLGLPGSEGNKFVCNKTAGKLYLAYNDVKLISVIDTNSDTVTHEIPLKNKAVNILISPDDKFLYAAIRDSNEIAVIDTQKNEVVSTIPAVQSPYGLVMDSKGSLLFITNYCAKTLSVFDLKNNRMLSSKLDTGADKGNPLDVGVYEDKDGSIRAFIAKEVCPARTVCGGTKDTGLDVAVFTFRRPSN